MSSVVVKNPETASPGLLDRLHLAVLAGVVYVVGSLAVLFELLPWLWYGPLGFSRPTPTTPAPGSVALLALVGLVAAGLLAFVGRRLLGPQPAPGVRAGIFTGVVTVLLVVLLTRWASLYFEEWVYKTRVLPTETVGIALTAAVGLGLLALALRFLFLAPTFGPKMVAFEDQGWFSTNSYKRSQGQRVRRGTIMGILILAGCGIYTMQSHGTLAKADDWTLNVPFTGVEHVAALNDAVVTFGDKTPPFNVDLGTFYEKNDKLVNDYVKLDEDVRYEKQDQIVTYSKGDVIPKGEYDEARKAYSAAKQKDPAIKKLDPATGTLAYTHLTLLPDVRYTLPILLAALAIWGAWRVVNVPGFGDFLIATEAELNKVSWTTRRRLIQDTVVVLVTVLLFTIFLFVVDVAWGWILSAKPIGVLKFSDSAQVQKAAEQNW